MRRYGDNPDGWRLIARFALTRRGGIILCVVVAVILSVTLLHVLKIVGWL